MARFNTQNVSRTQRTPNTTNLAGGQAYAQSPELELASLVSTSMVTDQYYRSADDTLARMRELVGQVDPYFAAQAAVYVRNSDGLRSITHALAGEIAHTVRGEQWLKDFYRAVVRRPDDITEILSYYMGNYGKPLPNSMKKGLGLAFGKFDEYQLAKYRGTKNALSLVDAVNLVHPHPTAKNRDALAKLIAGKLRSTGTFESKLSAAGSDVEAKEEAWKDLVLSGKIGYLALLRNLRNIAQTNNNALINAALGLLIDPKRVRESLTLPFQYVLAADELSGYPKVVAAISKALDLSLDNIPDLGENVLIAIDHSGSMDNPAAGNPNLTCAQVGDIFAAALFKKGCGEVVVFGDNCGPLQSMANAEDSVLTIAHNIGRSNYGHGTNFHSIFDYAAAQGKDYDTVVIFSDMQAWVQNSRGTNVPVTKGPDIFAFDLRGYGTSQFAQGKVHQLSGFSDKSITLMGQLKRDPQVLVTKIKEVTFT